MRLDAWSVLNAWRLAFFSLLTEKESFVSSLSTFLPEAEKFYLGEVVPKNSQTRFDSAIIKETNSIDPEIEHRLLLLHTNLNKSPGKRKVRCLARPKKRLI